MQVNANYRTEFRRYMMLPEQIPATDALRIGLVDKIVENEEGLDAYEKQWRKLVKQRQNNS